MMKKGLLAFIGMSVLSQQLAFASGIPVVDVAGIAQMIQDGIQQANEAMNQLNATRQQIEDFKNAAEAEKKRFEGNWKLSDVLSDPTLTSYLPSDDWQKIYDGSRDVSALREEYGLYSENEDEQKVFDSMLTDIDVLQDSYSATVKRTENIKNLAAYMDQAQTPQQKADYQNRIAYEQLQIQNEKIKIDTVAALMEKRQRALNQARMNAAYDKYKDK